MAIAGERSERTADFLAMLPVSRGQIAISKWVVSFFVLTTCAAFSGSTGLLLMWSNPTTHWTHRSLREAAPALLAAIALWTGCTIFLYWVGWLFSTISKSGPISAYVSIGLTAAITSLVALCVDAHRQNQFIPIVIAAILGGVGIFALISGTIYITFIGSRRNLPSLRGLPSLIPRRAANKDRIRRALRLRLKLPQACGG